MKAFLVVSDEFLGRTILAREVTGREEEDLLEALMRYPNPDRYAVELFCGCDWREVAMSHPRYGDAPDPENRLKLN